MDKKHTILAVDDAELSIDVIIGILKQYDVIPALNANDALDILENEKIDLILLDIIMPETDGYELCKIIKNNEKTKNIPVIFLTARTTEADVKKGFDIGAVDYVIKPFNPTELLARVNTHLELLDYRQALEERVKIEVEKSIKKDRLLHQQSKQAALGELLLNISHQWKQPLNQLATINMVNMIKLQKDEKLTHEELNESFEKTDSIIKFMDKTMNTFQNFFKPSTKITEFEVYDTLMQTLNIIDARLNYHGISVKINKDGTVQAKGIENEFSQVLLNIMTNAKDALVTRKINKPVIEISIEKEGERSKTIIKDNAGGINDEILESIFEPFLSEKDSTGIGLHMSKSIIEKNGGELLIENGEKGAVFTIIL